MEKRIVQVFLLLWACFGLFANVLGNGRGSLVYETEHFDIIYQEEAAPTAMKIAAVCEQYYREIALRLDTDIELSIPVVISRKESILNAYYMPTPYPYIVVYDTIAGSGELACLEDLPLPVFYHELAHAISLNIKTDFWQGVSGVLGSWVNPARWFYLNESFVEGLAVAMESYEEGTGRVNDSFTMQLLTQGKLEEKTPAWLGTSGARDLLPAGVLPYYYGGAFSSFLISEYGIDRYASFIHEAGKIRFGLVSRTFSDVFGLKLDTAYQKFVDQIPVPAEVISAGTDLLEARVIRGLELSGDKLYIMDGKSGWLKTLGLTDGKLRTIESFLSEEMTLSFSRDGRMMAESIVFDDVVFSDVRDLSDRSSESTVFEDIRRACLQDIGNKYFIAGVRNEGVRETLEVYDVESRKLLREIDIPENWNILDMADLGSSWLAIAATDGNLSRLLCYNVQKDRLFSLENPENLHFRDLNVQDGVLTFSYTGDSVDGTLARYGKIVFPDLKEMTGIQMQLSGADISGGVYSPVLSDGEVYFTGHFYETQNVRSIPENELRLGGSVGISAHVVDTGSGSGTEGESDAGVGSFISSSSTYKPLAYFTRGSLIPFSMADYELLGPNWYTADPTESFVLCAGLGYDPLAKLLGGSISWTDTSRKLTFGLPIDLESTLVAGYDFSLKQPEVTWKNTASYSAVINNYERHKLYLSGSFNYYLKGSTSYFELIPYIQIHRLIYSGNTGFEKRGYVLGSEFTYTRKGNTPEYDVYVVGSVYIPHLLPFENSPRFAFNLPATFSSSFDFFTTRIILNLSVVLGGYEIQRPVDFLSLYFQRIYLSSDFSYNAYLKSRFSAWSIRVLANLDFTPVLGVDIQNLDLTLFCGCQYSPTTGAQLVIGIENPFMTIQKQGGRQ